MSLVIVPISLEEANAFVASHHRHHAPVIGHKFSIAAAENEAVRGVAIIGRPVARGNDDGWTLEVNRCCTDGARNACSILYGAVWRAARAMGYRRLITYTLPAEGGVSLRAAGWKLIGERGGRKLEHSGSATRGYRPIASRAKTLVGSAIGRNFL